MSGSKENQGSAGQLSSALSSLLGGLCLLIGVAFLAHFLSLSPKMKPAAVDPSGEIREPADPTDELVRSYHYTQSRQDYLKMSVVLLTGGVSLIFFGLKKTPTQSSG